MPCGKRRVLGSALAVALLAIASRVSAQTLPSVDVRTWRPSTDPRAGLAYEPTSPVGPWAWNAGAWLGYTYRSVSLRRSGTSDVVHRPLEHLLSLNVTTGIGIGERAAFGVDVPLFLFQEGSSGLPPTVVRSGAVPTTGLGDVGLVGKATIVSNQRDDGLDAGFGLAAISTVTVPTGDRESFMGEGATTVSARLLAEYSYLVANVQASLGYKLRTSRHTWPQRDVGGVTFGDEIPWSVALTLRPKVVAGALDSGDRQRWELAAHGWLPAGPVGPFGAGDPGSARLSPALLSVSDRVALGRRRDTFVLVGAEVGLNDAIGVPLVRAIAAFGWAPRAHDRDHDGVDDDVDQCLELAEDRDGIDDADGCPEDDADEDGILDTEDACPRTAGVFWNDPKKNGCPGPDADGDGVADSVDACPGVQGVQSEDPKRSGCPEGTGDQDQDGVDDAMDRCPTEPEDRDGVEDDDGCPELDNDGDTIPDTADACPNERGDPSPDPTRNGCPNRDRDGDTFPNDVDQCPDAAEVFNGVRDDDGCPDEGGSPLVSVDAKQRVSLAGSIRFAGTADAPTIEESSMPLLRALALELGRHREWTLAVGARPGPGPAEAAQRNANARAAAVVRALAPLVNRTDAAKVVPWATVKGAPNDGSGLGFVIEIPPKPGREP